MEKRVLKHVERHRYTLIGYTSGSFKLYYLHIFLENLSLEEAKQGASEYVFADYNDFVVDRAFDDNYYVAMRDSLLDSDYEIEINGEMLLDFEKIPQLKLTYENFDYIFKAWIKILEERSPYLILMQHDSGWVEIQGKDALSLDEQVLAAEFAKKYPNSVLGPVNKII